MIGYEKGPFSEEKVDHFLEEMKKKYQTVIDNTKRQRVSKWLKFIRKVTNVHLLLLFQFCFVLYFSKFLILWLNGLFQGPWIYSRFKLFIILKQDAFLCILQPLPQKQLNTQSFCKILSLNMFLLLHVSNVTFLIGF